MLIDSTYFGSYPLHETSECNDRYRVSYSHFMQGQNQEGSTLKSICPLSKPATPASSPPWRSMNVLTLYGMGGPQKGTERAGRAKGRTESQRRRFGESGGLNTKISPWIISSFIVCVDPEIAIIVYRHDIKWPRTYPLYISLPPLSIRLSVNSLLVQSWPNRKFTLFWIVHDVFLP